MAGSTAPGRAAPHCGGNPPPAASCPRTAAAARGADLLAIAFGTTVAMWAVGFVGRLPGWQAPPVLLFALLLACLLAGGYASGALTRRSVRGGLYVGLISGALNLLVLGSLIGDDQPNAVRAAALLWIPGSLVVSAVLAAAGAAVGGATRWPEKPDVNWPAAFGLVAVAATLLLLAVGGSVTGFDYGLAVVDWPNTAGYNMFLYPQARWLGGIYFEHSHRLIGSLVGLTTLALAVYLTRAESRPWLKRLAWAAFALVVVQGVLGGLRVTGRLTLSTDPQDTAPNLALAITHGVIGQVFFGLLVALAVFLTRTWTQRRERVAAPRATTDRTLAIALVILILAQLVLGALVRHFTWAVQHLPHGLDTPPEALIQRGTAALHMHIAVAVGVALLAVGVGVRAWGLHGESGVLRGFGLSLLGLVGLQLVLGIAAVIAVGNDSAERPPTGADVLITTAHQTGGAVLLGMAVALTLWNHRLLDRVGARRPSAASASPAVPPSA